MSTRTVDLDITGMTCASCVSHVTKSLDALPGVTATVNLATERARVAVAGSLDDSALIGAVEAAGYHASVHGDAGAHPRPASTLAKRLIGASILTLPVLLISMIPAWQFNYWQYLVFALTTPVVFWAGWPFHRSAWANLRQHTSSMDTLVSVGTLVAYGWSVWALFFGNAGMVGMRHEWSLLPVSGDASMNLYFETAAVLTTIILLGRWLEERSRRTAGAALAELSALLPERVRVREQASLNLGDLLAPSRSEREVPLAEVRIGQQIVLLPGETVPVDGVLSEGHGLVDESALTGESRPREVAVGDALTAGSIVLDARLLLTAERVGAETRLAQLTELVDAAQVAKSSAQRLADRISAVFVPAVLGLALLTGLGWLLATADLAHALSIAIAVVIIACPCALGLATPVAIMAGTGRGAQLGIILSGPDALERSRAIRRVFLDKTGTLTEGQFALSSFTVLPGHDADALLAQLAALEAGSQHPIAAAVAQAAAAKQLLVHPAAQVQTIAGHGLAGTVGTSQLSALAPHALNTPLPEPLAAAVGGNDTAVVLSVDGVAVAVATFADQLKADASQAIVELQRLGVRPVMVTGDRAEVANLVARQLGLTEVIAEASPEDKAALVAAARAEGDAVAMVGDGINDAAALATADLGIAIGSGTDLARAASDITLLRGDASAIPQAIRLARATRGTIIGNLVWAFGYNIAAIPLAMAGLLSPMIAGAAMAFSSVFVVLNSIRLTRFR